MKRGRGGGRGVEWRCEKGPGIEGFPGLLRLGAGFGSGVERTDHGLRWLRRCLCIHPLRGDGGEQGCEMRRSRLP